MQKPTAANGSSDHIGGAQQQMGSRSGPVNPGAQVPQGATASGSNTPDVLPHPSAAESNIADVHARLSSDHSASRVRKIVDEYLSRISAIDAQGPTLRSVIEVNPDATAIADRLDRSTASRGPLFGIPVLIKDNIDTADRMLTTAGSLALVDSKPAHDAFIVTRLRDSGAVLLGKTNLSEWANFRSNRSSSGWSGRGGQTRNPYALDRNPCGSSSGSGAAIAAGLAVVAVGTETDGSIVCPSSANGLVGIKPTVGLVSRTGIIPISASQDTAGPMARTVADAAALLTVLAGYDPQDPATAPLKDRPPIDYNHFLNANSLEGVRIGVMRQGPRGMPLDPECLAAVDRMARVLADCGHAMEESHPEALDDHESVQHYVTVVSSNVARALEAWSGKLGKLIGADDVEPLTWMLAERGRGTTAGELLGTIEYVHAFGPRVTGLRATEDELEDVARRYRVGYARGKPDARGQYEVTHSSGVFAFDGEGRARLMILPGASESDMVSALRRLAAGSRA